MACNEFSILLISAHLSQKNAVCTDVSLAAVVGDAVGNELCRYSTLNKYCFPFYVLPYRLFISASCQAFDASLQRNKMYIG